MTTHTLIECPSSAWTDAIQDAIDNLTGGKGEVILGAGTWQPDATIAVPDGVTLRGVGRNATKIDPQHSGAVFDLEAGVIANLWIDAGTYTPSSGIYINGEVHGWTVDRVRIYDCTTGIDAEGYQSNTEITRCRFQNCTTGVRVAYGARRLDLVKCRFNGNGTGLKIHGRDTGAPSSGCNDIEIVRCNFEGAGSDKGVVTVADTSNDVAGVQVAGSRFEGLGTGLDVGTNTGEFRYADLYRSGNTTFLSDSGNDTAEGWR